MIDPLNTMLDQYAADKALPDTQAPVVYRCCRCLVPVQTFHTILCPVCTEHEAKGRIMPHAEPIPLPIETLTATARGLSSGTLASLIGESSYAAIDKVQADFVLWCTYREDQTQAWQDAWSTFWTQVKPRSSPAPMATLALEIEQAAKATQAQIRKEQGEAEWKTRRQPRKAQAAPCGMFEQAQGSLF